MTNWQEYLAGTDPHNRQDVLRFDGVSISNQICLLQFNTHTGRTYAIERLSVFGPTNTGSPSPTSSPAPTGR